MSNLTDYEIQNIQKFMESFSKKALAVQKALDMDFDNKLYHAQSSLSSYAKLEESAVKSANNTISQVWGTGRNNRNNINELLRQKGENYSQELEKAFDNYSFEVKDIVNSLPQIGDYTSQRVVFRDSEYTGDIEIADTFGVAYFEDNNDEKEHHESDGNGSRFEQNDEEAPVHVDKSDSYEKAERSPIQTSSTVTEKTPAIVDTLITDSSTTVLSIDTLSKHVMRKLICSNVSEIQANAFKGMPELEIIVLSDAIRTINVNAFRGLENKCVIAFTGKKEVVESNLTSTDGLNNRRVVFDYHEGDEFKSTIEPYSRSSSETTGKSKRTVIRKNTPLDNDAIKEVYLSRNAKYELTMDELNQGIEKSGTNTNKEEILLEALRIKRIRDLKDNSFWNYAKTIEYMIQLCEALGRTEEELSLIFALFYLDSSGYRMVNGKYNPYKQEPHMMYYHPKMQMQNLRIIQEEKHFSNQYLEEAYANSPYVLELTHAIKDGYYSLDTSIKMMLSAMENPYTIFYPGQSKFKRIN